MATTISTNYLAAGVTLTNTADSPVYISPGITIGYTAGVVGSAALSNAAVYYWSVTNGPRAVIEGNSFGISLNGAGTVTNMGSITASYAGGPGFSYDGTTHVLLAKTSGVYTGGGGVSNSHTGTILGGLIGVDLGGAGSIVNAGSIADTYPNYGFGAALAEGGSVTNLTGGSITGGRYGILTDGLSTVTNQSGATISGGSRGIFMVNGDGSVDNLGGVSGATTAIALFTGGTVTNGTGASVAGGLYGIVVQYDAGSVDNLGSVTGTTAAIALFAGGTITNETNAVLGGGIYGIVLHNDLASVTNQGTIIGTNFAGIDLLAGGGVGNLTGGAIDGGYDAVVMSGTVGGTITNQGSLFGTAVAGVYLIDGGYVSNETGGTITGGDGGIIGVNEAVSVTNAGSIHNTIPFNGQTFAVGGVLLLGGGSVKNSGQIVGSSYGVDVASTPGTVTNSGVIVDTREGGGAGVILVDGGLVSNSATGTIASGGYSVQMLGVGTVINSGLIASYVVGGAAAVAIQDGGAVTNGVGGRIDGEFIGLQSGEFGSTTAAPAATIINAGSISASDNQGDGAGVWLHGPVTLINQAGGVIEGGTNGTIVGGPLNGYSSGPFGVVAYYQTTLVNYGSIGGSIYSSTLYHQGNQGPKQFAFDASNKNPTNTISNLIKMAPGASFGGVVLGSDGVASSTLELMSGASTGTIRSFGSVTVSGAYYQAYLGFGVVQLDAGARWKLGGTVSAETTIAFQPGVGDDLTLVNPTLMQGTITGFAPGDTIGAVGVTVIGSNYAGGLLTLTDTSSGVVTFDLPGTFATGQFEVTNNAGTAEITILPRTLSWTGDSSTAFGTAANWDDISDGLNPAQLAPNAADTAEFDSTEGGITGTGTVAILQVGSANIGELQLSDGASIVAGSLDAGILSTGVAEIGLTGAGTELTVTGSATVADDGTGVMSVLSGATFTAANLTIGSQGDSSGALVVSGQGSVVNISGDLNVGTALGTGDLTVGPGATVNAQVINLQGAVVLENGTLDPTVNLINQGLTAGGSGAFAAGDIVDEGVLQAGASKASQKLLVVSGTIVGGGPWTINGTAQAEANGDVGVLQINAGGTMEINGVVSNAALTTFTDDVTPQSTYAVSNSVIDVNFEDAAGVLKLDNIAGFAGTITTFHAGDKFVITGGTLSGVEVNNGHTLTVQDSGHGGTDQIIFGSSVTASEFTILSGNTIQVACFAAGTRIETETGLVAVEALKAGDRVRTMRGDTAAIVWMGQRHVDCRHHPDSGTVCPVRVLAGAFGPGLPSRDLWLSPDHAVFVEGVLIPVHCLINGGTIRQMVVPEVTYYHVELAEHDVILAEDLPVESYLETGDRANFSNGGGAVRLFPNFIVRPNFNGAMWEMAGCAPLVMTGPVLERVKRALARVPVTAKQGRARS